ncbi:copper-binding protein [Pseudomonas sp. B392_1p]|uniref:copper-binding protein n=1 Tax=Pseudomonas sp. B392_1p TaxID=3457507 RepID=UPI003FD6B776
MKYALIASVMLVVSQGAIAGQQNMPLTYTGTANNAYVAQNTSTALTAEARGTVKAVNTRQGTVSIAHNPVPGLQWPAMIMDFDATPEQLKRLYVGSVVEFEFIPNGLTGKISTLRSVRKKHQHKKW